MFEIFRSTYIRSLPKRFVKKKHNKVTKILQNFVKIISEKLKCRSRQENYQDRDELKQGAELKMMFEELCKQWIRYQKKVLSKELVDLKDIKILP